MRIKDLCALNNYWNRRWIYARAENWLSVEYSSKSIVAAIRVFENCFFWHGLRSHWHVLNNSAVQVDLKLLSKFEKNLPGVPSNFRPTLCSALLWPWKIFLKIVTYIYKKMLSKKRDAALRLLNRILHSLFRSIGVCFFGCGVFSAFFLKLFRASFCGPDLPGASFLLRGSLCQQPDPDC